MHFKRLRRSIVEIECTNFKLVAREGLLFMCEDDDDIWIEQGEMKRLLPYFQHFAEHGELPGEEVKDG